MSIALFNEPIEVEIVKAAWQQTVTSQGLLIGIEQAVDDRDAWGYVVREDGMITQVHLDQCRTKFRYDEALEDWEDHSGQGTTPIDEADVPSGGPD